MKTYILIVVHAAGLVSIITGLDLSSCVQPPLECPNENVTFFLYTRSNKDNPHQLFANNQSSIKSAPWVKKAPVKILIHGYTGHKDFSPNTEIRPAFLKCCDYNIISVDYNPIAREPCYLQAAANTELVGKCTAQLIDVLVQKNKFALDRFHVIGFSLGGQTAGFVGSFMKSGNLYRISGLDPALPLFATTNTSMKLDPSDADFVDVVHTNALEKGKLEESGDIDFYPNGGLTQPGCMNNGLQNRSSCDHSRAPAYFAESILTKVGFYGTQCYSWMTFMIGWCDMSGTNDEVLFGEYVPYGSKGIYVFTTNSESPYAQGRKSSKRDTRSQGSSDKAGERPKLEHVENFLLGLLEKRN